MNGTMIAAAATITLSACAPMPAAISEVSSDRVKVVQKLTTPVASVAAEAERACAMYDRISVGPISYRILADGYSKEVLFICKPIPVGCQNIAGNVICPSGI
jgi:hypothetical protein